MRPGESIEVVGVYRTKLEISLNARIGFPVTATQIVVNNISSSKQELVKEITNEDIAQIKQLSRHPNIRERIIASIAPTLCASKQIKTAIAYALFGGVPKGRDISANEAQGNSSSSSSSSTSGSRPSVANAAANTAAGAAGAYGEDPKATAGQHVIRGDINVLLLGALSAAERRSLYTPNMSLLLSFVFASTLHFSSFIFASLFYCLLSFILSPFFSCVSFFVYLFIFIYLFSSLFIVCLTSSFLQIVS